MNGLSPNLNKNRNNSKKKAICKLWGKAENSF